VAILKYCAILSKQQQYYGNAYGSIFMLKLWCMTQAQLQNIIKGGENISVEFKKCPTELNHSVFETVCSFLNRTGGHLILGVADGGNITGVNGNCIDSMIKNFVNTVNNPELLTPTFYFSPEVFTVGDDKIIYIYIPESSQVHRYKGKIYDRVGDADNDITSNHYLINNIYLRKNRDFAENEVFPFLEVTDLDDDTFKKARRLAGVWRDHHPWLSMDNAEILHSCGLWRKDSQTGRKGYTLAAALLFGKENTVLSCCPAYKTDAVYRNMAYERFLSPQAFDPDVRYDDRYDIRVNLIEAYLRLMAFINRNLPEKFHLEGIQRIDIRDKIFREIAANLLIHREYSHSFPAKFLIFSDRVITENWTKPAGQSSVTLDNLETHPKNPMIARVFKELGWVEELGSGRKNIKKYSPYYYDNYQISIENEEKFIFSITYRDVEGVNLESEGVNLKSEGVNLESEGVNLLFELIRLNSGQRIPFFTSKLNVPPKTIERWIKKLRDEHKIIYTGSSKTGGYYANK
jgi:ATP-dependent DNA helicase RecG